MNEEIEIPCNCSYREEIHTDLLNLAVKWQDENQVDAIAFSWSMCQLVTFIFKAQGGYNSEQIMSFMKEAVDSLQVEGEDE